MHILYDGDCSFCIKIIEKISKLINKKEFYCYAFKSKNGEEIIINYKLKKFDSVIFINKKNQILYKGPAVFNICKHMKKQASSKLSNTILPSESYPEQSISELAICEVKPSEHTSQ